MTWLMTCRWRWSMEGMAWNPALSSLPGCQDPGGRGEEVGEKKEGRAGGGGGGTYGPHHRCHLLQQGEVGGPQALQVIQGGPAELSSNHVNICFNFRRGRRRRMRRRRRRRRSTHLGSTR